MEIEPEPQSLLVDRRTEIREFIIPDPESDPEFRGYGHLRHITNGGLQPADLEALPTFTYTSDTNRTLDDCAICLSEFAEGDEGRDLPDCNHSFHSHCIDQWLRSHPTCPLCRSPVQQRVAEPDRPELLELPRPPVYYFPPVQQWPEELIEPEPMASASAEVDPVEYERRRELDDFTVFAERVFSVDAAADEGGVLFPPRG